MAEAPSLTFQYESVEDMAGKNLEVVTELLGECGDYIQPVWETAQGLILTELVVGNLSEYPGRDTFEVGYRAFHFALSAADALIAGGVTLKITDLKYENEEPDDTKLRLRGIADDYLAQNPTIDNLIGQFMLDIDRGQHAEPLVERVAAMVFYMADATQQHQAMEQAVAEAMAELDSL